ncbi:MAG: hypothetical protein FWG61_10015 [Firmicutes bacterium]|nr:hypothetical protein [Bacillota bacterium]
MELEFIAENRFTKFPMEENLQEEVFASDWELLLSRHTREPWEILREMFVELSFPIGSGQSKNPELLVALKRGILPSYPQGAWKPIAPAGIMVYLHPTPAGRLPVIECEADTDFIRLLQSLAYRCDSRPVPKSRGATIIKNYNNWARINMHRNSSTDGIPKDPALYRDCIALLSHRYYSGVTPEVFGLKSDEWRKKSLVLRREHEVAHYMTQRLYHSAKNEIHDEIIADFMGLTAAFGDYDPDKFLTFLGLENYPDYRAGGRLEIYLPTNDKNFSLLCEILPQAAKNIAAYYYNTDGDRIRVFHALCRTSMADIVRGKLHE